MRYTATITQHARMQSPGDTHAVFAKMTERTITKSFRWRWICRFWIQWIGTDDSEHFYEWTIIDNEKQLIVKRGDCHIGFGAG